MNSRPTRRAVIGAGGLALAGLGLVRARTALAADVAVIRMQSDVDGAWVGFDPIGLWVAPGATVRWELEANVHTTTAYHPRNGHHSLRIPDGAEPWDSGYLVNPGDRFELTLAVDGVYDYFCVPHEMAGMVGRIIVGQPSGPGTLPFDYFRGDPDKADWIEVPAAAQAAFPSIARIMTEGNVPLPPPA